MLDFVENKDAQRVKGNRHFHVLQEFPRSTRRIGLNATGGKRQALQLIKPSTEVTVRSLRKSMYYSIQSIQKIPKKGSPAHYIMCVTKQNSVCPPTSVKSAHSERRACRSTRTTSVQRNYDEELTRNFDYIVDSLVAP